MANPFEVQPVNPLQALMVGQQAYGQAQEKTGRAEAAQALQAGGNPRDILSKLIGAGDIKGAAVFSDYINSQATQGLAREQFENTKYTQSPAYIGQVENTKQGIAALYAPKTTNIKTPGGDEFTVEKGGPGGGYRLPTVQGLPPDDQAGGIVYPPGVDKKAYKEARSKQLGNIDDKAILEADKVVDAGGQVKLDLTRALELNKTAYSGPFANERGYVSSQFGGQRGVDTQELHNVVVGQALENLRAVFGGNPTEGERKILLDVQGAASQSPEVRQRIYERALIAAERRTEINKKRADAMRSGQYLLPEDQRAAPATNSAPSKPGRTYDDAVNLLKRNPRLAEQFDEKYGVGKAARILGVTQ